jgi:hypothetical protein
MMSLRLDISYLTYNKHYIGNGQDKKYKQHSKIRAQG